MGKEISTKVIYFAAGVITTILLGFSWQMYGYKSNVEKSMTQTSEAIKQLTDTMTQITNVVNKQGQALQSLLPGETDE